jgi:hypothetical protein
MVRFAYDRISSTEKRYREFGVHNGDSADYGHVDLIATRPSKRDFLLYIRDEMVARAKAEAERLRDVTEQLGISLEVISAETEDVRSTVIGEMRNGYCAVFVPHQKRRIFPLLERNLGRELKRKAPCQVILC